MKGWETVEHRARSCSDAATVSSTGRSTCPGGQRPRPFLGVLKPRALEAPLIARVPLPTLCSPYVPLDVPPYVRQIIENQLVFNCFLALCSPMLPLCSPMFPKSYKNQLFFNCFLAPCSPMFPDVPPHVPRCSPEP